MPKKRCATIRIRRRYKDIYVHHNRPSVPYRCRQFVEKSKHATFIAILQFNLKTNALLLPFSVKNSIVPSAPPRPTHNRRRCKIKWVLFLRAAHPFSRSSTSSCNTSLWVCEPMNGIVPLFRFSVSHAMPFRRMVTIMGDRADSRPIPADRSVIRYAAGLSIRFRVTCRARQTRTSDNFWYLR